MVVTGAEWLRRPEFPAKPCMEKKSRRLKASLRSTGASPTGYAASAENLGFLWISVHPYLPDRCIRRQARESETLELFLLFHDFVVPATRQPRALKPRGRTARCDRPAGDKRDHGGASGDSGPRLPAGQATHIPRDIVSAVMRRPTMTPPFCQGRWHCRPRECSLC
jgi:hypothetical protein